MRIELIGAKDTNAIYPKLEAKQEWCTNSSSLNAGLASGLNEVHGWEIITRNGIVKNAVT